MVEALITVGGIMAKTLLAKVGYFYGFMVDNA